MGEIIQRDNRIVGPDGKPIFPTRLPLSKAVIEREWYFLDDEGREVYLCVVRRVKDDELFQAGLAFVDPEGNPIEPVVTDAIWHWIMCAFEENHGLEIDIWRPEYGEVR